MAERGMIVRTPSIWLSAVAAGALLLGSCGTNGDASGTFSQDTAAPSLVTDSGAGELFVFEAGSVREHAAVVAVVTVDSESEHPLPADTPPDEAPRSLRDVEATVETPIAGDIARGDSLRILDLEGYVYPAEGERTEIPEKARLSVGDRVAVVLLRESKKVSPAPAYLLLSHDSFVILRDGHAVQTGRTNQLVAELEQMSQVDVIERLQSLCSDACDATDFPQLG